MNRNSLPPLLLWLACLFFSPGVGWAGDVPEQEPNDSCGQGQLFGCGQIIVPAFLQTGEDDWYEFEGNQNELVDLVTDELDPGDNTDTLLEIYANDCNTLLAADDNGSENGNYAGVFGFPLPYTGTYHVRVTGAGPSDAGPYILFTQCQTGKLSRQEAIDLFINDYIMTQSEYADSLVAFLFDPDGAGPDSTLAAGTTIANWDSSWVETIPSETYFFWTDDEPRYEFTHHTSFVLVDAHTGFVQEFEGDGWPVVEGEDITYFTEEGNTSPYIVYGNYDEPPPDNVVYTPKVRPNNGEWAIILVGKNLSGNGEREARRNDIKRIKSILNEKNLGPRIPAGNIDVLDGGPQTLGGSKDDFCTKLDAIDQNCKKLWIFYIGHGRNNKGGKDAGFILRKEGGGKEVMDYDTFACKLLAKDLPEYCIVVEDCHSGWSVPSLSEKGSSDSEGRIKVLKGGVITSSDKNKTHRWNFKGAPFIIGLYNCWCDPGSDLDRSGRTSMFEALTWAGSQGGIFALDRPQARILGDNRKVTIVPPYCSKPVQIKISDARTEYYVKRWCYQLTDPGTNGAKTLKCRTRLYAKRKSALRAKNTEPVSYWCKINGVLTKIGELTGRDRSFRRGEVKCVAEIPPGCREIEIRNDVTNKRDLIKIAVPEPRTVKSLTGTGPGNLHSFGGGDPLFEESHSMALESYVYAPGEFIFRPQPLNGVVDEVYEVELIDPPDWDLESDPDSFVVSALVDTPVVITRGTVPFAALTGASFESRVLSPNLPADSSGVLVVRNLVDTAESTDLGDGTFLDHQFLRLTGSLAGNLGEVRVENSVVLTRGDQPHIVGPNADFVFHSSSIYPDSASSYSLSVSGALDWVAATCYEPASAVVLDGVTGIMNYGGVLNSLGAGLLLSGELSGLESHFVIIDSSTADGVIFDGASSALLNQLSVENSGGEDIVLSNSSVAELRDSEFDEMKVTVGTSSTLTRSFTTSVYVVDQNGAPVPGVSVQVRDAFDALVASALTDTSGFTSSFSLQTWVETGSTRVSFTPHEVSIELGDWSTTIAHTADESANLEAVFPGVVVEVNPPLELPTDFRLEPMRPNPVRSTDQAVAVLAMPSPGKASIEVIDVQGRRVWSYEAQLTAGFHRIPLGEGKLGAGVYWTRAFYKGTEARQKMTIIR